MNPFPLWRGITRHICDEAASAVSAAVDALPDLPLDFVTRFALFVGCVALPLILNIGA
jgi:hypothetical protein